MERCYLSKLAALVLLTACSNAPDDAARNIDHLNDTVRVAKSETGNIEVALIDTARLRESDTSTAPMTPDISDIVLRGRKWHILDYETKRVLVFDSTGTLLRTVGVNNDSAKIVSPRRIAFAGDTLLIVDLGSTRHIRAFDPDGREVGFAALPNGRETSDIASTEEGFTLAMRASAPAAFRERATFVSRTRDSVASTCPADRRYREAHSGSTLLSPVFTTLGVGHAGRIACVQAISPVIAVYDPATRKTAFMTRMPSAYKAPLDRSMDMNAKAMAAYQASWTQQVIAYPTKQGALSIYELPRDSGGRTFLLFACDSASGRMQCGEGTVRGKSVRFVAPDTLLIARGRNGLSVVRLHIRRWY